MIKESDEFIGLKFIEEIYLPVVRKAVMELLADAESMKASMEGAVPILRTVLGSYGLLDYDPATGFNTSTTPTSREKKKAFKVNLDSNLNAPEFRAALILKFTRY